MICPQSKESIEEILNHIRQGEAELVLPYLAEDAEIHICLGNQLYADSFAATFMGHAGVINFLTLYRHFLEIHHIAPTEFYGEDRKIIVRGDLKCQMATTGRIWSSSWMQIWTFEENLVYKLRMFADFQTSTASHNIKRRIDFSPILSA